MADSAIKNKLVCALLQSGTPPRQTVRGCLTVNILQLIEMSVELRLFSVQVGNRPVGIDLCFIHQLSIYAGNPLNPLALNIVISIVTLV